MTGTIVLLVTLAQIPQAPQTPPTTADVRLDLAGRPLAEALQEIQAGGLAIVFSPDLVRPDMRVREQPKATRLPDIVNEILAPHGLTTRAGENGTLVVVLKFTESVDVTSTA